MFFQTRLVYTIIICAGQIFAISYGIPNGYSIVRYTMYFKRAKYNEIAHDATDAQSFTGSRQKYA